jgi:2-amino-4-hydroxy-6-hydroxymethyldihydropteridine diphosphokinase
VGGNVGRPRAAFRRALGSLLPFLSNPRLSGLYRTSPVGGPPQPDFLNAVVVGETRLAPLELLGLLKRLERESGRRPGGPRNGPRPLDLDLLLYGARRVSLRHLRVPHPRMTRRLFVLVPLAELTPERVVPGTSKTVARLLLEESSRLAADVTLRRVSWRTVTA